MTSKNKARYKRKIIQTKLRIFKLKKLVSFKTYQL